MNIETLNSAFEKIKAKVEEEKLCLKVCGSYGIYLSNNYLVKNLIKNKLLSIEDDPVQKFFCDNYKAPRDIDFISTIRNKTVIERLFSELGYAKDNRFESIPGIKRSIFFSDDIKIDVFYDGFDFNHFINLTLRHSEFIKNNNAMSNVERINTNGLTIPLTELLLQKLQIVNLGMNDIASAWWLLKDTKINNELSAHLDDGINLPLLKYYTSKDWGFYITVESNLKHMQSVIQMAIGKVSLKEQTQNDVWKKLDTIRIELLNTKKTMKWKVRAIIGTSARWYNEVDDI
ncbi:MAG: hypothetical protein M1445_11870 [Bacteroidetes bacterium]|nr:hypothetical protein [Bacteroidota bacterium]